MQDFFFNDIWRMDWGLGNPNKTAALIATLMIAVWTVSYIWKKGFWVSIVLFTGLSICLVHTFSRGGIIACFAGLAPALFFAPRPWPWRRVAAVLASVWVAVGFSVYLQAHERFAKGVVQEDRSITNRLDLWKSAPTMIKDAPGGWGLGNSGRVYMDWYQPLDRHEVYRTMVNSHLTWLVELGWVGRFLYLLGWLTVLSLCLPGRNAHWLFIPFGIWLAFFVAATFSSVAESLWLWIVPTLALGAVLIWRCRNRRWPAIPTLAILPVAVSGILLLVHLQFSQSGIRKAGAAVIFGSGAPSVWVVADREVLGKHYGRALRSTLPNLMPLTTIGFVETIQDLPEERLAQVILSGRFTTGNRFQEILHGAKNIVVVNPLVVPKEFPLSHKTDLNLTVLIGEFSQSPAAASWKQMGKTHILPGVGDFLPDWPSHILRDSKSMEQENSSINGI